MPHSNQPRANPPPTRPRVTPVRVVRTRKRTRSANIARDSVEMALVYLAESIYHHGNIAPPPLPQGVHALSDLTGRNLALYVCVLRTTSHVHSVHDATFVWNLTMWRTLTSLERVWTSPTNPSFSALCKSIVSLCRPPTVFLPWGVGIHHCGEPTSVI